MTDASIKAICDLVAFLAFGFFAIWAYYLTLQYLKDN